MSDPRPAPPGQEGIHRRLMVGWANKLVGLGINFGEQFLLVPVFLIFWGPEMLITSPGGAAGSGRSMPCRSAVPR